MNQARSQWRLGPSLLNETIQVFLMIFVTENRVKYLREMVVSSKSSAMRISYYVKKDFPKFYIFFAYQSFNQIKHWKHSWYGSWLLYQYILHLNARRLPESWWRNVHLSRWGEGPSHVRDSISKDFSFSFENSTRKYKFERETVGNDDYPVTGKHKTKSLGCKWFKIKSLCVKLSQKQLFF